MQQPALFFLAIVFSLFFGEHHNHHFITPRAQHNYRRQTRRFGHHTYLMRPFILLPFVAPAFSFLPHPLSGMALFVLYAVVARLPALKKYPMLRSVVNTFEDDGECAPWCWIQTEKFQH